MSRFAIHRHKMSYTVLVHSVECNYLFSNYLISLPFPSNLPNTACTLYISVFLYVRNIWDAGSNLLHHMYKCTVYSFKKTKWNLKNINKCQHTNDIILLYPSQCTFKRVFSRLCCKPAHEIDSDTFTPLLVQVALYKWSVYI